jgi:hypothetical protein
MEEEFLVCVMVGKPTERGPGKSIQDPMAPYESPDSGMIRGVVVLGIWDVDLESTGNKQVQ